MAKPAKYQIEKVKGRYVMTDEQRKILFKRYPGTLNPKLASMFGVSLSTIVYLAKQYGLHKDEKLIAKQRGALIVKACTENGYYASLKGKSPSDACINAMVEKIKGGWHPFQNMTAEAYDDMLKRQSDTRKRLIESERRRINYGLGQRTKLNIPQFKFTPAQYNQRYRALNRGYLLASKFELSGQRYTIYYDDETERSPRFERSCVRNGFTVKEYKAPKTRWCERGQDNI